MGNLNNYKVIFLDIDGVLNTPKDYSKWRMAMEQDYDQNPDEWAFDRERHIEMLFCPKAIGRLNQITEATGAHIVISSSWRMFYSGDKFQRLIKILRDCGVKGYIVDHTSPLFPNRWTAIEKWIDMNDPTSWLILDDESPPSHLKEFAPEIWGHVGLADQHIDFCLRILTRE